MPSVEEAYGAPSAAPSDGARGGGWRDLRDAATLARGGGGAGGGAPPVDGAGRQQFDVGFDPRVVEAAVSGALSRGGAAPLSRTPGRVEEEEEEAFVFDVAAVEVEDEAESQQKKALALADAALFAAEARPARTLVPTGPSSRGLSSRPSLAALGARRDARASDPPHEAGAGGGGGARVGSVARFHAGGGGRSAEGGGGVGGTGRGGDGGDRAGVNDELSVKDMVLGRSTYLSHHARILHKFTFGQLGTSTTTSHDP